MGVAFALMAKGTGLRRRSTIPPTVETFEDKLRREQWQRHTSNHYRNRGVVPTDATVFPKVCEAILNVAKSDVGHQIVRAIELLKTSKFYDKCYVQYSGYEHTRYEIDFTFGSLIVHDLEKYIYLSKRWINSVETDGDRHVLKILVSQLRKTNRRL
jgi:hypothetical protein